MKSIVLLTLSLFLGAFFIFIGSLKVTQLIHREMHREIRRNFIQYARVFPLSEKTMGFKLTPKLYRLTAGYLEIVCGALLVVLPNSWRLKNVATVVLLLKNLLALHSHYKLNDKFERMAPSIVFALMLACRLVVYLQVKRRIENEGKQKAREERRKLIESGEFDLDQLSTQLSATDDDEPLDDISYEELERLIKINRKLHSKRRKDGAELTNESEELTDERTTGELRTRKSRLLEGDKLVENESVLVDQTKKGI